ncbi:TolC family protein [Clostridiisalibacter paucivorans]|uniref:TolC family protein n=1 Tax=Clostridiisalibacter paucivorans TaxID=408753 RepID=UPI00047913A5|nr:TolC family protein [Clostridiisalibacter paucivorans]
MKNRVLAIVVASMMIFTSTVSIAVDNDSESSEEIKDEEEKVLELDIQEAVKIGLENSISLEKVRNEIDLSEVKKRRAKSASKKLEDGDEKISDGRKILNKVEQLESLPDEYQLDDKTASEVEKLIGRDLPSGITAGQMKGILEAGNMTSKDIEDSLEAGKRSIIEGLQTAGTTISGNLNFDSLDQLPVNATSNVLTTMSNVAFEVTKASYDIYKNQIAMLIQKSYYDVLKAKQMLEVKERAMERGKKQYEFVNASYEEGMKAKDDMLMSQIYYQGTEIEYNKALGEYENALTEFKKNINIPLDKEVVLTQVMEDEGEIPDIDYGIENGLKERLEIRKSFGEVIVYETNFENVEKKYPSNTFQNKEARLLKEKARINYKDTVLNVKNSIYQSYETLKSTGEMLKTAKGMVEQARENLEIAQYKYKEGFGVETSLLKKLDLESSAGTIIEVLAAEEKVAEVEEKVVQIKYGYNLAKMKYYNDIGDLIY